MMHPTRSLALIALATLAAPLAAQRSVYPGKEWEKDPRGLSPSVLRRIREYLPSLDTTSMVVVKGGRIVYEYGDTHLLSYLASSRKSILSMLYGKYASDGTIDLKKTLKELGMSDVGGLLPIEETATVRDLITARSGVYHPASNAGDLLDMAPPRGSQRPGTYWLYSNWDFNAAGAAFERMTGKDIFDALRDDLAVPIGMQDFDRKRQQKLGDLTVSRYPAYHMWFSTRDMARLGYLMLRHGRWSGRQIVPESWVTESTSVVTPPSKFPKDLQNSPVGYGYMWWVWCGVAAKGPFRGAYTAMGAFGQYITVLPALDMVVAHKVQPVRRGVSDEEYFPALQRLAGWRPASEDVLETLRNRGSRAALEQYRSFLQVPNGRIVGETDLDAAGAALLRQGRPREAVEILRLAASLYPQSARSLIFLSQAEAAAGWPYTARATAERAVALNPGSGKARLQLSTVAGGIDGRRFVELPPADLRRLSGRYATDDREITVEPFEGKLLIRAYEGDELADEWLAFPLGADRFYVGRDGTQMTFRDGALTAIHGKESWTAKRNAG